MKFATLWDCDPGAVVTVSNGDPQPSSPRALRIWASHNFVGTLSGKGTTNGRRWLDFDVAKPSGAVVTWRIYEGGRHRYATSALSASALPAYAVELAGTVDAQAGDRLSVLDGLLVYAKWQEVRDINALGLAGVQALTPAERASRFPFLTAELAENPGLTGQQAVDRFTAQTTDKVARAARIEARRSRLARALAAATTQVEMEAVTDFGTVD